MAKSHVRIWNRNELKLIQCCAENEFTYTLHKNSAISLLFVVLPFNIHYFCSRSKSEMSFHSVCISLYPHLGLSSAGPATKSAIHSRSGFLPFQWALSVISSLLSTKLIDFWDEPIIRNERLASRAARVVHTHTRVSEFQRAVEVDEWMQIFATQKEASFVWVVELPACRARKVLV